MIDEIYAASLAGLEAIFFISPTEQITGRDIYPIDLGIDAKSAVSLQDSLLCDETKAPTKLPDCVKKHCWSAVRCGLW